MDFLRTLLARCAALVRRHLDDELDDELRAHIELAIEENMKRGMPPEAARISALRAFGGLAQTRESYRVQRGIPLFAQISRDLKFSIRQLRKSPGFAFTAILTLALGIGANTAIFSVMNAVLLRTLPVHDPGQLFYVTHEHMPNSSGSTGDSRFSSGINVYNRLRADRSVLDGVIAYIPLSFDKTSVRVGESPEEVRADEVSGNFFSTLGVSMAAGSALNPDDETRHASVAVLSYGYWNARFNRDPNVLGRSIFIRGVPFIITGVAEPHFYGVDSGGSATDLWIPLQNRPEIPAWGIPVATGRTIYSAPDWWSIMLMARLKPGVTPQQAAAHLNPVFSHAAYEFAQPAAAGAPKLELQFVPARGLGTADKDYEEPLHVLMGMVVLVLVIACVNIVMLLIARNSAREREFALRLALGARRWSLFRQLLAESLLLVSTGPRSVGSSPCKRPISSLAGPNSKSVSNPTRLFSPSLSPSPFLRRFSSAWPRCAALPLSRAASLSNLVRMHNPPTVTCALSPAKLSSRCKWPSAASCSLLPDCCSVHSSTTGTPTSACRPTACSHSEPIHLAPPLTPPSSPSIAS